MSSLRSVFWKFLCNGVFFSSATLIQGEVTILPGCPYSTFSIPGCRAVGENFLEEDDGTAGLDQTVGETPSILKATSLEGTVVSKVRRGHYHDSKVFLKDRAE